MQFIRYNNQYLKTNVNYLVYNDIEVPYTPPISATVRTVGSGGYYPDLATTINDINEGNFSGEVVIQIISSITELPYAPYLFESGHYGVSNYSSVLIYPTVSNCIIDITIDSWVDALPMYKGFQTYHSEYVTDFITLNNTINVTIDGRVNRIGSSNLTFSTAGVTQSTAVIKFLSPINSLAQYCNTIGNGGIVIV